MCGIVYQYIRCAIYIIVNFEGKVIMPQRDYVDG